MTEIVTLPKPPLRLLFSWLLPLTFTVGCGLAAIWPGHGGQLFGIGAFVGVWAYFVFAGGSDPSAAWWLCVLAGAPIVWLLGRLLDRLRTELPVWLCAHVVFTAAAGYLLLQSESELGAAIDRHGSLLAVLLCALQLGGYAATLVALAFGSGRGARA